MHHLIILVLCGVILIVSLLVQYDDNGLYLFGIKSPIRCMLYHTFGIKCAFCGMSRAFCALGDGHFIEALRFHRLGPAFFAFIVVQVPYRIYALITAPKPMSKKLTKANAILFIALLAAVFLDWFVYLGGLVI